MTKDDTPQRFRLIEGGDKPKAYRARSRREASLLTCRVCEFDTGVASATTMEVKQGRMIREGKPQGGSKVIICVMCLSRGVVTRLLG